MQRSVQVSAEHDGQRADAGIAALLGISRSAAAAMCAEGHIASRGSVLGKSERLQEGQWLDIEIRERADPLEIVAQPIDDMDIIADEADYVVVDKPVGVAAHPSPGWVGPTVVGGLAAAGFRISTSGARERAGIVHRLDVGTSGVMVVAKTEAGYSELKRAFKERTVSKVYHALVQGLPDPLSGTIEAPIGRHPGYDWRFAVTEDGRPSVTHYEVIEAFGKATLVEVQLETGRTHQIRVHFSALKHPCAGDLTYGADPKLAASLGLTRQWLHATSLGFTRPGTTDVVEYTSNYPQDLQYALQAVQEGR
ncbi:RluA family pseudouridine synthase [Arthrobacter castelli]|uniref:RluA family pseudouridine synthase n=1 Tax=Arthrobacter castelli TaxID=271431 RepID=UPI0004087E28|nr:RluA family pseudouridine synthase [Arthrobacter castelli]